MANRYEKAADRIRTASATLDDKLREALRGRMRESVDVHLLPFIEVDEGKVMPGDEPHTYVSFHLPLAIDAYAGSFDLTVFLRFESELLTGVPVIADDAYLKKFLFHTGIAKDEALDAISLIRPMKEMPPGDWHRLERNMSNYQLHLGISLDLLGAHIRDFYHIYTQEHQWDGLSAKIATMRYGSKEVAQYIQKEIVGRDEFAKIRHNMRNCEAHFLDVDRQRPWSKLDISPMDKDVMPALLFSNGKSSPRQTVPLEQALASTYGFLMNSAANVMELMYSAIPRRTYGEIGARPDYAPYPFEMAVSERGFEGDVEKLERDTRLQAFLRRLYKL